MNSNESKQFDSLIFDMDGTLWDAVDSYCYIWDITFARFGINRKTKRQELIECMGLSLDVIMEKLASDIEFDSEAFLSLLDKNEKELMPKLGGRLYADVAEDIPELAKHYKLFLVSNCGSLGLVNFMRYTHLTPYITDTLTWGETSRPKNENIATIIQRHGLKSPIYIGDTQGDADAAHLAGIPIAWAAYGFGKVKDPEITLDSFHDLFKKIR
jgi:phosphoglycolate phosphatase